MSTFDQIERLHRRIHIFAPDKGDDIIRLIHELSKITGESYIDLLEKTVNQILANELPRFEGTGDRLVAGRRKAKHPTRIRKSRLQKSSKRNDRTVE